jgi:hypothetical protein
LPSLPREKAPVAAAPKPAAPRPRTDDILFFMSDVSLQDSHGYSLIDFKKGLHAT